MWHAIRTELAYFRPWLLGALGIAAAVTLFVSVVFQLVDDGPPLETSAVIRGFFPMIAGMVTGFIAQSYRSEERRARLLLSGPLTPRQLAWIAVLVPALLFASSAIVSGLVIGIEYLITRRLDSETLRAVSGIGAMFFAIGQTGPLAQESTAARRQRRSRAMVSGWSVFLVAIAVLTGCQFFLGTIYGNLTVVIVGLIVMTSSMALYRSRTDFTR